MKKHFPSKLLSLSAAKWLGQVVDVRAGRYSVAGEVRSIYRTSTADGSWTVGSLAVESGSQLIPFTAKGIGGLQVGRFVDVEGFWIKHPEYGVQLSVESCRRSELPRERKALVRYLTGV